MHVPVQNFIMDVGMMEAVDMVEVDKALKVDTYLIVELQLLKEGS